MGYYVGLDVSLKSTHICVLDGSVAWFGAAFRTRRLRWSPSIFTVGQADCACWA